MKDARIVLIAVILASTGICRAETTSELARKNAELRKRVEKLERELEELKQIVIQEAQPPKMEPPAAPKSDRSKLQKAPVRAERDIVERKPVWSNLDIQLYGYVKLDAAYDTSRVDTGNFARWVESETTNKDDDQFNMTANQTKLGLKIATFTVPVPKTNRNR
ncbi:MAG: hypothetical protein ACYSR6_06515 [Planctomycetota bacterium]|jgi:hypothetical protein